MDSTQCDSCWYYDYDEEFDEYYCMMDLDEDEMARYLSHTTSACPYFEPGDEYKIVRKQN